MRYPNLEAEMVRAGIGKTDLANLLGIHVTGVYQMMNGTRTMPVFRAKLIRDTFFPDMGLEYLFEEEE